MEFITDAQDIKFTRVEAGSYTFETDACAYEITQADSGQYKHWAIDFKHCERTTSTASMRSHRVWNLGDARRKIAFHQLRLQDLHRHNHAKAMEQIRCGALSPAELALELLCARIRRHDDEIQDLWEARHRAKTDALDRAVTLAEYGHAVNPYVRDTRESREAKHAAALLAKAAQDLREIALTDQVGALRHERDGLVADFDAIMEKM